MSGYTSVLSNPNSIFYMRELNRAVRNGRFYTKTGYPESFICDYQTPRCCYCGAYNSVEDMYLIYLVKNEWSEDLNDIEYSNKYHNVFLSESKNYTKNSMCKICKNVKDLRRDAQTKIRAELKLKKNEQPEDLIKIEMLILATKQLLQNKINPKYIRL